MTSPDSQHPPATPAPGNAMPPMPPGYVAPPQGPSYVAPPQAPGYAPQYGSPQSPAPQYYAPQYGAPQYGVPPKPATGTISWAMGFLVFLPIPFLGMIVAGIVMASVYGSSARKNPVAEANARSAANWGITALIVTTGLLVLHFVLLFSLTANSSATGFYPLGIPITLYVLVVVLHIVLTIVGTVRSGAGNIVRVPFAIPFLRGA